MYSSALAALIVLGACSESTTTTPPPPSVTPPTPVVTPGLVNDGVDAAGQAQIRATALNPTPPSLEPAPVTAAKGVLATANTAETDSTGFRTDLQNLGDLTTPAKVAAANALIGQFNTASGAALAPVILNDDLNVTLTAAQTQIDTVLVPSVTTSETALAAAYGGTATTNGAPGVQNAGQIVLADGTVLQTRSFGLLQADATGEFTGAQIVAAFEQDATGRVTRVAYVEATGAAFAPDAAVLNYTATGGAVFGVRVNGGFFDKLDGTSSVTLNSTTQSGTVTATGFSVDQLDTPIAGGGTVNYAANVNFNPATGAFTSSNGQVIYNTVLGSGGGGGTVITQANNAVLDGQLRGPLATADYTGVITSTTADMETVGAIIGR